MKYFYIAFIVYCLTTPLISQNSVTFSLGTEYYNAKTNYQDASGVSLAYIHQTASAVPLGIRFNYSTMSLDMTSPSANKTVNVSSYDLYLVSGYTLDRQIFTLDIKTLAGAGLKILEREAFTADLGALGKETNPRLARTYFTSFIALVLSKNISGNLRFFIEPAWAFYNINTFHNTLSFKGGIDVSFN